MVEIKLIDAAHKADILLKNDPFPLYGRMIPDYIDEKWGYSIQKFPPEQTLIPEDMDIKIENIVALEDRLISCPEAPFVARFRVWGTGNRPVFVFWKAVDDTEWTLVLCQQGTDVMPEFPGDGLYAVGRA